MKKLTFIQDILGICSDCSTQKAVLFTHANQKNLLCPLYFTHIQATITAKTLVYKKAVEDQSNLFFDLTPSLAFQHSN